MTRSMNFHAVALALSMLALSLATPARAETLCGEGADVAPGTVVVVGLATGDTLVVTFAGCSDTVAVVDHELLGRINLPPDAIAEVVAGKPGEDLIIDVQVFTDGQAPPAMTPAPVDAAPAAAPDAAPGEERIWATQAEFGLNGSQGNSERLSLRLGARSKRSTEKHETSLGAAYTRSDEARDGNASETTENKALANANNDWLFPGSPWRYFLSGAVEVDEFQAYDLRLGASTGPAYAFIDNDTTVLIGRAGLSTTSKIGGEDADTFFELVFGYDFEHAFTEHQKIVSAARIFPNMTETGEYRATALLAYDLKLSVPAAVTLRLGIEDRYDSTVEDTVTEEFEANDFDYYATLIWDF